MKRETYLKGLLAFLLLMVGANPSWADDPVNWLAGATVSVQYASNDDPTALEVALDNSVTFTPATDKTEIRLNITKDQIIHNGQIFLLIEGTNIKKDDAKLASISIDGSTKDSNNKSYGYTNANAIPYAPSSQLTTNPVVIMAPLSRDADGTDPTNKPNGTILLAKFIASESMTVNSLQVIIKLTAANTETSIKRVGMYTLGEITQIYTDFQKIKWQYKENNLLGLQDGNNNTYSASQKTIALVSGKTITKDIAKILFKSMYGLTDNYTEIDVRNLAFSDSPTAFTEDLLSTNTKAQYLFDNTNTLYRLFPSMRIKSVNIKDRKHYQYKDNVNLTDGQILTNNGTSPTVVVADYTRNFPEGYSSCVLPFDVNEAALPSLMTAYTFTSATAEGKATFTKVANNATISAGTPFVVKTTTAGIYMIPAAETPNRAESPNNYYATDASNNVSFVGSFVNSALASPYSSNTNYGVKSDGTIFEKWAASPTAGFFRAFLSDARTSIANYIANANPVISGDNLTVVLNGDVVNQTQNIGYSGNDKLSTAISEANAGDVIVIYSDQTLSSTVSFDKNLTIKPAVAGLSIKRATTMTGDNDKVLLAISKDLANAINVTIGGNDNTLTIDGQSVASGKQLAEVGKGTLTIENTTFKNVVTSNEQGVLCAKYSGSISLTGVTFDGCQATTENTGIVFCGNNDGIKLTGTNTFNANCTGYNFCVEKRLRVPAAITAPASPYTVYIKPKDDGSLNIAVGSPVVCYTTPSHFATSHFEVKNAGYQVATSLSGNDLKLEKTDYTINLPTDGTVTINLADATKAHIGDEVTVTVTVPATKQLEALTYTPEGEAAIDIKAAKAFTMPAKNVTIAATYVDFVSYEHPIMLHTQADIDRVKANIGLAPIKDAWAHLQQSNYASASYTNKTANLGSDKKLKRMDAANWGPSGTHGQYSDYDNYKYAMQDANAAYQLALRYRISGETQYATAAVNILNAWATNCTGVLTLDGYTNNIPDPNEYLICIQGHQFANAAELLRGYSGWAAADFDNFKTWIKKTFVTELAEPFLENHHNNIGNKHYWLNWDLAAMTSMLSVGILCDDKTLTDYAINYYKGTAVTKDEHTSAEEVGYYTNAIPYIYNEDGTVGLGQCQESGRDQGHSTLDVALLAAFCQMAKNLGSDGEDLFATDSYRAVKMAEYVGKYNLRTDATYNSDSPEFQNTTIDWTNYETGQTAFDEETQTDVAVTHTAISANKRGTKRPGWEIFYAYAREKGLAAKYSEAWAKQMRSVNGWGDGGAGDYGTTSGGFDQLGYGTLMYADPTSADGQDAAIDENTFEQAGYTVTPKGALGDTYVRKMEPNKIFGTDNNKKIQMEVYTSTDDDFKGLLSFKLPAAAVGTVQKAQLRLVTKRRKNTSKMNIYKFVDFDETAATYSSVESDMTTATSSAPVATFTPKGQSTMDVTSDGTKAGFNQRTLEQWTNRIDLTSYVQSLTGRNVNLLLSDVSTADTDGIQFFTKEWNTDLTSNGTTSDANGITAAAADLVPQLIVIYTASGTPGVFNVGGDSFATLEEALEEVADGGTITVTGNATVSARTTFAKNVTLKGQTGSEVISRGTSSAAMGQSVLFKANSGKTVTFDGFIFDDNNATVGQLFEVDNNTFVLKNMTIKNSKSAATNGVISMKKGTLTIDNITFSDCSISNAYIRAAAGTLTLCNGYTMSSSTGNHFRLGNVALDATTLPAGITYKIEVEDAAATITNVSDASKFELTSDGYLKSYNSTTKVISFTKEGDGQDTAINEASYSGKTISKRGATGDTYVRSDNMTSKNGSAAQMEIRTNADGSNDFVGLISFKLPGAAVGNVTKAQLRLVTKQKKTNNRIRLYAVGEFDEKNATYETMSSAITAARGTTLLAKFKPKGETDKDVTKDVGTMSDDSKKLSAWTNYIDLTSYLNSLTTADVNLMLTESEGDGKAIQFFTKERTDAMETSVEGNAFNAASADLVPQLIVVFAEDTSNRKAFYISGEGSYDTLAEAVEAAQDGDEIIVTKNASVGARVTFTKNVTLKAESGVVLSRSAEEAAMKQSVLFKANSGKTVTFDGIVFDDNNATVGQLFEVDNNTFVLKNMTIKNSKSTSANGVISMKKGTLTVEGITFTDCAISNAYLRAAAGTLNFSGNYKLTNSTGNHFRLGSVALNGGTLPAIEGTWRIEVESDGASITNVTDASKFSLVSVGYTMSYANNTITFTAEGDGQDTSEIVVPEGYNKSLIDPIIDTYVRKGNAGNNGQRMNMEVYTYQSEEEDLDFAGLMAFKLPDDLTKSGAKLEKAQLRLVSKRVKGSRIIDMFQLFTDFDEEAIYDQMEKRLTDAREGGYMRRFQAKGQAGLDIEADSLKLTDEYKDIKNWTNLIDLTDVVQNVMFDDGILRFALSAPVNGKDAKQFYTSEAETFKNAVMQVSYADLIPQLILVYSPGSGASTLTARTQEAYPNIDLFLRKGSTSDNSSSEVMEVFTFNDGNQDQDFIGLMSFNLDNEVASARSVVRARSNSDLELFNATLRLVTKRLKGEREMNLFLFDTPFGATSTYSQLESAIIDARTNGSYVTFKSAGMEDKDVVTDDGLTGDYSKTITAWTNYIDVTNLVKSSDMKTFSLMLSAPDNARTPKHYFSGDAESFTNSNYSNFIVSSDELVPLLTITYRNPLYTDIEETIVVPVKEEHIIYDLRGNRVQTAGKGIYIIDGKKVLNK